jgi:hypothetical protein
MTTSPVLALRQAIRAVLSGDVALMEALGGRPIFDEAPRHSPTPYIIFAETQLRDWSCDLSPGAEQFLTLSVITTQNGTGQALILAQKLHDRLAATPPDMRGHRLIDLSCLATEMKRDLAGRIAKVNLRYRAISEYL